MMYQGLGPKFDWALADFDLRNVFHFSGGYQLPIGKGMRYLNKGRSIRMPSLEVGQSTGL